MADECVLCGKEGDLSSNNYYPRFKAHKDCLDKFYGAFVLKKTTKAQLAAKNKEIAELKAKIAKALENAEKCPHKTGQDAIVRALKGV